MTKQITICYFHHVRLIIRMNATVTRMKHEICMVTEARQLIQLCLLALKSQRSAAIRRRPSKSAKTNQGGTAVCWQWDYLYICLKS